MEQLKRIVFQFLTPNNCVLEPIQTGLINKTYLVEFSDKKYILQNINTQVFKRPEIIMDNIQQVNKALLNSGYSKAILCPLPTLTGKYWVIDNQTFWRMFPYLENTQTYTVCTHPDLAFEAAKTYSEFYAKLIDTSIQLQDPIPNFINFTNRIDNFTHALSTASKDRIQQAQNLIDFAQSYIQLPKQWIQWQQNKELPIRVIHADPKISNLLFNPNGTGNCVIDLDTLMQDTVLYDFGDMIRSYTNTSLEDDINSTNVFSTEMYQSVTSGFLYHLKDVLEPIETENLAYAAQVVVYIQMLRFLTDYLQNDTYYRTTYPLQNFNRATNQMYLLQGIFKQGDI